jgi:hypothetical protein
MAEKVESIISPTRRLDRSSFVQALITAETSSSLVIGASSIIWVFDLSYLFVFGKTIQFISRQILFILI